MPITAPTIAGDNDDVDLITASTWLPALLDAVPGTSGILFDREMTIRAVGGQAWASADLGGGFDVGRRISEVMPPDVWAEFDRHLDALFQGRTTEFEYLSPRTDAEYHLTCRPVRGWTGRSGPACSSAGRSPTTIGAAAWPRRSTG